MPLLQSIDCVLVLTLSASHYPSHYPKQESYADLMKRGIVEKPQVHAYYEYIGKTSVTGTTIVLL
jgi:hypothetical protein